jgi:hypothetical protein
LDLYKATIIAASMNEYGTVLNKVYHGSRQLLKMGTNSSYVDKRKERAKRNKREALKQ